MNKESTFGVSKSTKYFHRIKHYVYLWKKHDSTFLGKPLNIYGTYKQWSIFCSDFLRQNYASGLSFSPRPIIHRKSRTKRICLLSFSRERTKRATTFCCKAHPCFPSCQTDFAYFSERVNFVSQTRKKIVAFIIGNSQIYFLRRRRRNFELRAFVGCCLGKEMEPGPRHLLLFLWSPSAKMYQFRSEEGKW